MCGVLGGGEEIAHLGEAQEMLHFLPSRCCWAWLRNLLGLAPLSLVFLGNGMALSCRTWQITDYMPQVGADACISKLCISKVCISKLCQMGAHLCIA